MKIRKGLCFGKISEVRQDRDVFSLKFESDDGYYDILHFEGSSRQLQYLVELLEINNSSPFYWSGTRVQLFMGPDLGGKVVMLYGIAPTTSELFWVPEYIFRIKGDNPPDKKYFWTHEVEKILEHTESML